MWAEDEQRGPPTNRKGVRRGMRGGVTAGDRIHLLSKAYRAMGGGSGEYGEEETVE